MTRDEITKRYNEDCLALDAEFKEGNMTKVEWYRRINERDELNADEMEATE